MHKRGRRSIVFLLICALLFANFTSAGTAFASETDTAQNELSAEAAVKQESELAETGEGEPEKSEEAADPGKEENITTVEEADDSAQEPETEPEVTAEDKENAEDAGSRDGEKAEAAEAAGTDEGTSGSGKEDAETAKEEAANPGETVDAADNAADQDAGKEDAAADASKENEAQPEESVEGADNTEQAPAAEPSEQKEDIAEEEKSQPDSAKKDARKADSAPDIEFKEMDLIVSTVGTTEAPLDVEYQIKLWTKNGESDVPFANQTLPSGETTDGDGVVKKSVQLPAWHDGITATISVPKGYSFKATFSPDSTDEVELYFAPDDYSGSHGIEGNTSEYDSFVCLAYVKPAVYIVKEKQDGSPLKGAKLELRDNTGGLIESWVSDGTAHYIRLMPNINWFSNGYYTLCETDTPPGYVQANNIQFKVYPDPTGVVIGNTQYKDYTIHMVNEKKPGSLRVEMDFDTQNDIIDSDTNLAPFNVTIEIDNLKTAKPYKVHYTYGQEERDITVYLGPDTDNKSFSLQLHSYDYLVLSGLPEGATYSVSQQTSTDDKYEDPVYDEFKTGTIESDNVARTVITNTARLYTWTLTKQVPGAYDGQTFAFEFYFVDDYFLWGSAPHYYELNGERHELEDLGYDYGSTTRIKRGVKKIYLKSGDTITVPNLAANAHYYYNEYAHSSDYVGNTNDSGALTSDYDVLAINVSKMVGIRKLDQYGNHVAGAKLQILGHDHSTVIEEFTTTDEDYFWSPKSDINDGSDQFYLHEVSAPGGYAISEEDIPFTYEKGEEIEYTSQRTDTWTIKKKYIPYVVTVNGEAVEGNILVMTDKATDVTISKTDITGEEELGGASLAVYKAEDVTDGTPKEGVDAIDSWTSEEGKSHQIIGKLEAGGEYVLIETTAPDGYEVASAVTFTVNDDGTPSTVNMVDEYSTHDIKISKTDVGGKEIEGAKITITGRAKGETKDIDKITYTTDGKAPHEVELKPGTYTMTEVTAPEGYEKAESITFTVEIDGSVLVDGKKVTDSTVTMVDEYFIADVKISKTDVGGKEIAGAEITITGRADGESEDIEEIKYTTDGKKPHEVELRPGTYTMTEVTAPNGYEKAESITFTVKADGTVLVGGQKVKDSTVTMVDEYSTHIVKISKTDVGGKEIAGAEITITGRADGESKDIDKITYTTDGKAPHEVELKPGTYTMTEVTAPEGYKKAESITFTVDKDGVVKVGGQKVTDSTVTMVDEYETFTVKISKTDVGGKEIKGAVLTITGREDGASKDIKEIRFTTDGKKPHEFSLKPGTYTLTEITAPSGYEKAESITFTVKADGTVLVNGKDVKGKVTMVDKAKTTKKTTTTRKSKGGRTGDESGVMLYMTIFAAAAAGLAAVLLRERRKG